MSVDEGLRFRSKSAGLRRKAKIRERHEKNRRERREKIMWSQAKRNHQDDGNMFSPSEDVSTTPKSRFQSMPAENTDMLKGVFIILLLTFQVTDCMAGPALHESVHNLKRAQPENTRGDEDELYKRPFGPGSKRTRTISPRSAGRVMEDKRAERERRKQERWGKIMETRKMDRDQRFMNHIFEGVSECTFMAHGALFPFSLTMAPFNFRQVLVELVDSRRSPQVVRIYCCIVAVSTLMHHYRITWPKL
jgi:hypothetical protein